MNIGAVQPRLPELVYHYVNLMLIKMVIGWELSKALFAGLVRLPTGLILEGQKSKLGGQGEGDILGSCGPRPQWWSPWLGFREHFNTLVSFWVSGLRTREVERRKKKKYKISIYNPSLRTDLTIDSVWFWASLLSRVSLRFFVCEMGWYLP